MPITRFRLTYVVRRFFQVLVDVKKHGYQEQCAEYGQFVGYLFAYHVVRIWVIWNEKVAVVKKRFWNASNEYRGLPILEEYLENRQRT